jgi:L-2-hydroxyglutarate oxidase LhgO
MGLMSKFAAVSGGRKVAKNNAGTVHRGIDKAAQAVKGRLGRQHEAKVDTGASWAKKLLTGSDRREPARG